MDGDTALLEVGVLWNFAIALFIGALIGVERERRLEEHPTEFGGLRTFILIALAGALAALLSEKMGTPWLFIGGLLGLIGLVATAYRAEVAVTGRVPGLTGEVAAIVTWLLAGTVVYGERGLAVMIAVVVTILLAFKQDLHKVVRGLARDDVVAGLELLFATFIVLPLLPHRPLDPWGALDPYKLWLLVVLISTLSLAGYAAVRVLGERVGLTLTGLFGGLVSSTAVTLSLSRQSVAPGARSEALALAILLSWTVMLVRVLVVIGVLYAPLARALVVPLVAMTLTSAVYLVVLWRRSGAAPEGPEAAVKFENPFGLWSAAKMGLLFAVVLLLVALARDYLPERWLYAVSVVAGATDVDPVAVSMAEQARTGLDTGVAALAVVVAVLSNTAVKTGLVVGLGSRALVRLVAIGAGLVAVVGIVAVLVV